MCELQSARFFLVNSKYQLTVMHQLHLTVSSLFKSDFHIQLNLRSYHRFVRILKYICLLFRQTNFYTTSEISYHHNGVRLTC